MPAVAGDRAGRGSKAQQRVELGRGTYGPLGGAGAPPRRFARHLPVERDGGTHFLAVEDVVAIHANAHYTYIFDGNDKLFCPLAIGDVESRLDSGRFVRVHRSHIVNIDRVVGYKRSGDNGMVEMASRARLPGAGQPQPDRLAEIAGRRRLTAAIPRLHLAAGTVLQRSRRRRLKRPCVDRSVMLTQFVQQCLPFVQRAGLSCIVGAAGAALIAAAAHKLARIDTSEEILRAVRRPR